MALFDKEKLTNIANTVKETVKDGINEAIEEKKLKEELGLLDDVSIKLEYKGGHPDLKKEKDCTMKITNDDLTISYGISQGKIDFSSITGIHYETAEQISRRITATRLLTLGVFAFAFKKKKKDSQKYLTIEFTVNDMECAALFSGKKSQDAYSKLFERYSNFKNRQSNEETTENSNDPYEELKKLKELLDMGIISEEEFESKKKELLNI